MKRPFLWAFGASVLGEILAYRFLEVKVVWVVAGTVLAACFLMLFGQKRRWLFLPVFFVCGFFWMTGALAGSALSEVLIEKGEVSGRFVGEVDDIRRTEKGWKVTVTDVEMALADRVIAGDGVLLYLEEKPDFYPGNRILVEGRVCAFEEATNPGQFDQRAYYRAMEIDGWCMGKRSERLEAGSLWLAAGLYRLRQWLLDGLDAVGALGAKNWQEMIGVLQGMLLGERALVPTEMEMAFERGGVSHVLAISGLHISLVGMGVFWLLKRRLALPYGVAVFTSCAVVIGYCAMTGKTASSARALCMFAAMLVGEMQERPYDMMSACGAAGLLVLADQPLLLFQAGFQLSFAAIIGIGLLHPAIVKIVRPGKRMEAVWLSVAVQVATLPVLAWHFYEWAMGGLLLNLLVIPMMPVLAGVGFLGMVVGCVSTKGGAVLLVPVYVILEGIKLLCGWVGNLPGMNVCLGRPQEAALFLYLAIWCVVVWYGCRRGKKEEKKGNRGLVMLFFIAMTISGLAYTPQHTLRMICLDVGQGDGVLMQFPGGTTMLVDGGSSDVDAVGANRLAPCLSYYGVSRLDFVVVTHMDEDHKNGVEELVEMGFSIGQILIADAKSAEEEREDWQKRMEGQGISVRRVSAGGGMSLGGVQIMCLYPRSGAKVTDENDTSLVLWVEYGGFAAMLMGDLSEAYEGDVMRQLEKLAGQQVLLKVAHHGSQYSTGQAFLEALKPTWSVISCGQDNSYGHPHEAVLTRLRNIGSEVWDTPSKGAVMVETDGKSVKVKAYCCE